MKKSEAIEVGFKVLSMYAFSLGISSLGIPISIHESAITIRTLQSRMGSVSDTFSVAAFLPSALLFLFGVLFWLNSKKAKDASSAQESPTESITGLTPQMLQSIIFSALGILVVSESAAALGNVISFLSVYISNLHNNRVIMSPFPYYRLVEGLGKLIFGGWLIIGSRGLRKFQNWLLENAKSVG